MFAHLPLKASISQDATSTDSFKDKTSHSKWRTSTREETALGLIYAQHQEQSLYSVLAVHFLHAF